MVLQPAHVVNMQSKSIKCQGHNQSLLKAKAKM